MYITVKGNNGKPYDDYYRGKNVYFKLFVLILWLILLYLRYIFLFG